MKYSIIVPAYNAEIHIDECLDSLISQTYHDFELLIVDDGSVDKTQEKCERYAKIDSRICYIRKNNEGVVIARQKGVEKARGRYLLFVDSDDWVSCELLECIDQVIQKNNPDLVCFESIETNGDYYSNRNEFLFYPDYLTKEDISNLIYPNLIQNKYGLYFSQSLWGKVFKKDLFQKNQLCDVRINIGEDFACVAPYIFHSNSIFLLKKGLYYYRIDSGSITHGNSIFDWDAPKLCANHVAKCIDLEIADFNEQLFRRVSHELFNICISRFNQNLTYIETKKDIIEHLNYSYYGQAINNSVFKGIKGIILKMILMHKYVFLLYLLHFLKIRGLL